jgi:hypothetical protein
MPVEAASNRGFTHFTKFYEAPAIVSVMVNRQALDIRALLGMPGEIPAGWVAGVGK